MVVEKVKRLETRLAGACTRSEVVNLTYATATLTVDIISSYIFGDDMGNLDHTD